MNSQGSNAIQAFVFPKTNQKVRVFIDEDGTLWFVAANVCRLLGYSNGPDAIKRHCKKDGIAKRDTLTNVGTQEVTVIGERNLYRLMGKSEPQTPIHSRTGCTVKSYRLSAKPAHTGTTPNSSLIRTILILTRCWRR